MMVSKESGKEVMKSKAPPVSAAFEIASLSSMDEVSPTPMLSPTDRL